MQKNLENQMLLKYLIQRMLISQTLVSVFLILISNHWNWLKMWKL